MVIEMLLNNDIYFLNHPNDFTFQKEVNIIMYIIKKN
jgi:hypothetical protein